MNQEQKQSIYNVLYDYFDNRRNGSKLNLHIESMASNFPDITKEVVKNLKRKTILVKGNIINIGMMCNPSFNIKGEIVKIGKMFIKVKINDEIIEFYTTSLNQKGLLGLKDNNSKILFIRLDGT